MEARQAKLLAKKMREFAGMDELPKNNGMTFDPGNANNNQTPDDSGTDNIQSEAIVAETTPTNDTGDYGDAGDMPFNPGFDDPNAAPGAYAQFQPGGGGAGSGGGSGGGVGNAGGTSAAKEEGKGDTGPQAKSQTGGNYAPGEGGGSRGRGIAGGLGGSGAVGVDKDPNFADMLKDLLGMGEEKEKEALAETPIDEMNRDPASDLAAVLGRNQNIFEAIHKRYQKKSKDGVVVFQ